MMERLLVASRNRGKLKEIEALLSGVVAKVYSPFDFPELPETIEDGDTFEENALKKAFDAARAAKIPVIADDSGLVVDCLGGAPGIYSARYAGENANDVANNEKLLSEIAKFSPDERKAAFVCVIAFVTPDGDKQFFHGSIEGRIIDQPLGTEGFGYDPLFLVNGFNRTMAELTMEEKNSVSHRSRALNQLLEWLSSRQENGAV